MIDERLDDLATPSGDAYRTGLLDMVHKSMMSGRSGHLVYILIDGYDNALFLKVGVVFISRAAGSCRGSILSNCGGLHDGGISVTLGIR